MRSRLDTYLDEMALRLAGMPAWRREEEIHEARQHLEALVQAYQELGSSETDAVTSALAQFGSSRTNARQLRRAWRRGRRSHIEMGPSVRRAFAWFGALALFVAAGNLMAGLPGMESVSGLLTAMAGLFALFAGWQIGSEAPGRGWTRLFAAAAPVFVAMQTVSLLLVSLAVAPVLLTPSWVTIMEQLLRGGLESLFLVGCPLGCFSATAAALLTERTSLRSETS